MNSSFKPIWVILAVFAGMAAVVTVSRMRAAEEIVGWRSDFRAAQEESFASNKPLLVYFTADWCGPCQQMKRTTWADPEVAQALAGYVPVKIDVDQSPDIARRFGVESIPSFTLVGKDGGAQRSAAGYMSSEELLRWLGS